MNIRRAKPSDKDLVLDFCTNTFEWGDYVDRVWDKWISDPSGLLLVYEPSISPPTSKSFPLGIIHIIKCFGDILWLEGLRVSKIHRNKGIATSLLRYSLNYGINKGIKESSALVSKNNFASQKMLEKIGFSRLVEYRYYNIDLKKFRNDSNAYFKSKILFPLNLNIKVPQIRDISSIQEYFSNPFEIPRSCTNKYFDSWRLYNLNTSLPSLTSFIRNKELLVITNDTEKIMGIAIVKPSKKISYYDIPIIQISYLNCLNISICLRVIYLPLSKYYDDGLFNNAQFFLPVVGELEKIVSLQSIEYRDRFYLYSKFL
jgi:ribosomal protein S18 acetylase RimI-like enzyme